LSTLVGLCAGAVLLGGAMVVAVLPGLWHGERARGLVPTNVASLTKGRVVLSGVAEPAWSVVASPFGRWPCVWYDAKSGFDMRGLTLPFFHQRNAVPFVLNDGSGRVLVLARRAWFEVAGEFSAAFWDRMKASPSQVDTAAQPRWEGPPRLGVEGAKPGSRTDYSDDAPWPPLEAETLRLLDTRLQPAPPRLKSWRIGLASDKLVSRFGSQRCVMVGWPVTVVGEVLPYSPAMIKHRDACLDGGASLGMAGNYVIGPAPLTGLDVLVGTPDQVRARGRSRVRFAVLGGLLMIARIACLAVPLSSGLAS
jgi:hypothetical protein